MRFSIRYLMEYRYDQPVEDNANALRVAPPTTDHQTCDHFSVTVQPTVAVEERRDYFGTRVLEFTAAEPHERLTIDASAQVTTRDPDPAPAGSWATATTPAYCEAAAEYLVDDLPAPVNARYAELVSSTRADTPLDTVRALIEAVPERFEYRPGVTYVGSTVHDLLEGGAGVCQDFAHLSLMVLREHGIGARYVSGYLFAPGGDDAAESAEVATHAWVEALIPVDGAEPQWVGADPTNRKFVGDDHVKIGHGRSYRDLPPIRGVYRGMAASTVEARVVMTRLENGSTG